MLRLLAPTASAHRHGREENSPARPNRCPRWQNPLLARARGSIAPALFPAGGFAVAEAHTSRTARARRAVLQALPGRIARRRDPWSTVGTKHAPGPQGAMDRQPELLPHDRAPQVALSTKRCDVHLRSDRVAPTHVLL